MRPSNTLSYIQYVRGGGWWCNGWIVQALHWFNRVFINDGIHGNMIAVLSEHSFFFINYLTITCVISYQTISSTLVQFSIQPNKNFYNLQSWTYSRLLLFLSYVDKVNHILNKIYNKDSVRRRKSKELKSTS